jgi:hypothetical protein
MRLPISRVRSRRRLVRRRRRPAPLLRATGMSLGSQRTGGCARGRMTSGSAGRRSFGGIRTGPHCAAGGCFTCTRNGRCSAGRGNFGTIRNGPGCAGGGSFTSIPNGRGSAGRGNSGTMASGPSCAGRGYSISIPNGPRGTICRRCITMAAATSRRTRTRRTRSRITIAAGIEPGAGVSTTDAPQPRRFAL